KALDGAVAYLSGDPDIVGASILIQAGIDEIVTPRNVKCDYDELKYDQSPVVQMLKDAGVKYTSVDCSGYKFPDESMRLLRQQRECSSDINRRQEKWDARYMGLAYLVASWSKDPSTKVGCILVDQKNRFISSGYNGFAMRV